MFGLPRRLRTQTQRRRRPYMENRRGTVARRTRRHRFLFYHAASSRVPLSAGGTLPVCSAVYRGRDGIAGDGVWLLAAVDLLHRASLRIGRCPWLHADLGEVCYVCVVSRRRWHSWSSYAKPGQNDYSALLQYLAPPEVFGNQSLYIRYRTDQVLPRSKTLFVIPRRYDACDVIPAPPRQDKYPAYPIPMMMMWGGMPGSSTGNCSGRMCFFTPYAFR